MFLYVKVHNQTGLRYLGKTIRNDPYKYPGSGTHWKRHLKKHGKDITTIILLSTECKIELKETGIFFSKLWNVAKSNEWANKMDEEGQGGTTWNECNMHNHPARKMSENGTHPWLTKDNPSTIASLNGTHNFYGGNIQSRSNQKRLKDGTHHLLDKNKNPTCIRSANGTHHFKNPDSLSRKKVRENQLKRSREGTHQFLGSVQCITPDGILKRIPKSEYISQDGNKSEWYYASIASKIGKQRRI